MDETNEHVRKKIMLNASSVNVNNKSAISIWCKLILDDEMIGSPTKLKFESAQIDMDDIKKKMKNEFKDDLVGISYPLLKVYTAANEGPLQASTIWIPSTHGGHDEKTALVVIGRKPYSSQDSNKIERVPAQANADIAERKAQSFVDALMGSNYEDIKNSNGMTVLRDIPKFETGENVSIFVRPETKKFWQACIDIVDTPGQRWRVAAVGTPGIWKTTTTPVLIRMLLGKKKTVVYLIRKDLMNGWYYEFIPQFDETVVAKVYPESSLGNNIGSLDNRDTYYIVDPGKTKGNCNPADDFLPKVIIVTSPDEKKWGGEDFEKERDSVLGFFLIYPIWSLEDLLALQNGKDLITLEDDEIRERYRMFGGVPRRIFTQNVEKAVKAQDSAIAKLTWKQVEDIVNGEMDCVGNFDKNAPKGILLAFEPEKDTDFAKGSNGAELLSPMIREKVYSRHIKLLWNIMIKSGEIVGRTLFEPYVHNLIQKNELRLDGRRIRSFSEKAEKATSPEIVQATIPCCPQIRLVTDPGASVNAADECTLLHSSNPKYPLIDCIFKDNHGQIHAIQITTGNRHKINVQHMKELNEKVVSLTKINLYYFVPSDNFISFKTDPAEPDYDPEKFDVFIVSIPNPNGQHAPIASATS